MILKLKIFFAISDCRQSVREKRAKKARAPEPVNFEIEPQQELDNDSGSQEKDIPMIPSNFLSPSVREYLELGKSIPGKCLFHFLKENNTSMYFRKAWCRLSYIICDTIYKFLL